MIDSDLLFHDVLGGRRGIEARMKDKLCAKSEAEQHDDAESE